MCRISIATICVTPAFRRQADILRITSSSRMRLLPDFAALETAREVVEIVKSCCGQDFDRIAVVVDDGWTEAAGKDYERLRALLSNRRLSSRLSIIVIDSPR